MTIEVKLIEFSRNTDGEELATLQLRYPRFIHSEFMTHRMFSRNASSSRAKPFYRWVDEIKNDLAFPEEIFENIPGMQGGKKLLDKEFDLVKKYIQYLASDTIEDLENINDLFYPHKQFINRYLEPFTHIDVIVTSTEWKNFFKLRDHPDADPTIHALASKMKEVLSNAKYKLLKRGEWHLPYVLQNEREQFTREVLCNISAARCARVSYSNHDGTNPVIAGDLQLAKTLREAGHMSPFEHQATPLLDRDQDGFTHKDKYRDLWSGNFRGWVQYRNVI